MTGAASPTDGIEAGIWSMPRLVVRVMNELLVFQLLDCRRGQLKWLIGVDEVKVASERKYR